MKVVSGTHKGATGMVVKVEQHVLIIISDTTKEDVSDLFSFEFYVRYVDLIILFYESSILEMK